MIKDMDMEFIHTLMVKLTVDTGKMMKSMAKVSFNTHQMR
mgnify:CR=1 FL=1